MSQALEKQEQADVVYYDQVETLNIDASQILRSNATISNSDFTSLMTSSLLEIRTEIAGTETETGTGTGTGTGRGTETAGTRTLDAHELDEETDSQQREGLLTRSAHFTNLASEVAPTRFRVAQLLGAGTSGRVWHAHDSDIGRSVALKQVKINSAQLERQLSAEIKLMSQIQHPRVPTIYDIDVNADKDSFIVMQYLRGDTLAAWITRLRDGDGKTHQVATFDQRAQWIIQLSQVVIAAHKAGVLHRDIKPENIIISPEYELSLVDWGLATRYADSETHYIHGTPLYMAPEQALGQRVDERADLFAVAMVAYELLSLSPPRVMHGGLREWIQNITTETVAPLKEQTYPTQSSVPIEYHYVVMAALELNPEERMQSVERFLKRFREAARGEFDIVCTRTGVKAMFLRFANWLDRSPKNALLMYLSLALILMLSLSGVYLLSLHLS